VTFLMIALSSIRGLLAVLFSPSVVSSIARSIPCCSSLIALTSAFSRRRSRRSRPRQFAIVVVVDCSCDSVALWLRCQSLRSCWPSNAAGAPSPPKFPGAASGCNAVVVAFVVGPESSPSLQQPKSPSCSSLCPLPWLLPDLPSPKTVALFLIPSLLIPNGTSKPNLQKNS
jgi:hypothetical protein